MKKTLAALTVLVGGIVVYKKNKKVKALVDKTVTAGIQSGKNIAAKVKAHPGMELVKQEAEKAWETGKEYGIRLANSGIQKIKKEKEETPMEIIGYTPQGNGLSEKMHELGDIVPIHSWERVGGENGYAYGLKIHVTPTIAFNLRQGPKDSAAYMRAQVIIRSLEEGTKLALVHAPVEGIDEHAMAVVKVEQ